MLGKKTKEWLKHYKESADEIRKDFFEYTDLLISVLDDPKIPAHVDKLKEIKYILEERECRILRQDPLHVFLPAWIRKLLK